ncbi:hypothetical protein QBC32DRAFT_49634 [Pseudoneurospora amorphoporcata]|uniref:Uncharacterized protein n=1 Tax=Pseudoneurospora amorphoporcata TaxID=241081 RepID=A0AAN6NMV5_9PEZI|nr:hypothetical protein QBC32DRAFT_49634 [Pseudoneurospora amorphoporcata]
MGMDYRRARFPIWFGFLVRTGLILVLTFRTSTPSFMGWAVWMSYEKAERSEKETNTKNESKRLRFRFRLPNNFNRGGASAESDEPKPKKEIPSYGTVVEWMDVLFLVPPLFSSYSSPRPGALLHNEPGGSVTRDGFFAATIGQLVPLCPSYTRGGLVQCSCSVVWFLFLSFSLVKCSQSREMTAEV